MPVTLTSDDFPLSSAQVSALWQATCRSQNSDDVVVSIRCVSEAEIQSLNKRYRGHDTPTNVLTFSYPPDRALGAESEGHDVALCLVVAQREAQRHTVKITDYVALLLVHAFLHVLGMDHEQSEEQDRATRQHEEKILAACGFARLNLAGV